MQLTLDTNTAQLQAALAECKEQFPFAMMTALNKSAEQGKSAIQTAMKTTFDRPTAWVINSLRIKYATKTNLGVALAFKDRNTTGSTRTLVEPHVYSGKRHFKSAEARLLAGGYLAPGYNIVPGGGATLDAYGNMSESTIKSILSSLESETAQARQAKGTRKTYGFAYWVNRVGSGNHLQPGIYKRVYTAFGTSLKPMLIFVDRARYKERLDFYGIGNASFNQHFPGYFDAAWRLAMDTAFAKTQGSPL